MHVLGRHHPPGLANVLMELDEREKFGGNKTASQRKEESRLNGFDPDDMFKFYRKKTSLWPLGIP